MNIAHQTDIGYGGVDDHARHIARAQRSGYLHQKMHEVSGLTRRIVDSVPEGTGMYLIGEGKVVHGFDEEQLLRRGVTVVTVDRDLPEFPPQPVSFQIQCDLMHLAAETRLPLYSTLASVEIIAGTYDTATRRRNAPSRVPEGAPLPGSFVASHIGRYLPDDDTATLLEAGMDALVPGGNIWLVDTPLAARANKTSGSPGFSEAYRLVEARRDVRIAVDEVIAPVVREGLYYKLNDMRARRPGSDDAEFFDAVEQGRVEFVSVPAAAADEAEFRKKRGGSFRVNGWGIRVMMLSKGL